MIFIDKLSDRGTVVGVMIDFGLCDKMDANKDWYMVEVINEENGEKGSHICLF